MIEKLEIIFNSPYANKLAFLGGTALRIVYNNTRFSEDLDFDNFNLTKEDFAGLTEDVQKGMTKLGFETRSEMFSRERFDVICGYSINEVLNTSFFFN